MKGRAQKNLMAVFHMRSEKLIVSVTSDMKAGTCEGGVAIVVNSASPLEKEKAQYAMVGVLSTCDASASPHSL